METIERKKIRQKIEIIKKTQEEVEFELPYFSKGGCHAYKVFGEKYGQTIQVYNSQYSSNAGIDTVHIDMAFDETEPISEEEFNQIFEAAMKKLKSL